MCAVRAQGIYGKRASVEGVGRGDTRLQYFDFVTARSNTIAHGLGPVGLGLSAAPDGRTIFYTRIDSSVDELMVVDGFR